MRESRLVRITGTAVVVALLATLVVWSLPATMAGASATFSPRLTSASRTAQIEADDGSAPYTLRRSSAKRVTRIEPVVAPSGTGSSGGGLSKSGSSRSSGSELARAQSLLAAQVRRHPILKGTTVSFGNARGYQAIAYYTSGRIVISPSHSASLERIISHEVWHIIDWRDNGKIDWGENVPH
jgi:hypothetical protein